MELYEKEAFISGLKATRKPVVYLVGSPFSVDKTGNGVPGISSILSIARDVVLREVPLATASYDAAIAGKTGEKAYQSAMSWLLGNVHQDAVNTVVRRAVLMSCYDTSTIGNPEDPSSDGDPARWYLPDGTRSLASIVCGSDSRYSGPVLTPNFDPLLSLAIQAAGGRPNRRVLDSDGALPRDSEQTDAKNVIHLHGYWRGSDTLHTATQLRSSRPKLKASLQGLLREHLLVVVAYGGWDDVFTNAFAELLHDDRANVDVMWCFHEVEPAIIQDRYRNLLSNVAPAIARGRFRGYKGIDCHSIFTDFAKALAGSLGAVPPSSTPPLGERVEEGVKEQGQIETKHNNGTIDSQTSHVIEAMLSRFRNKKLLFRVLSENDILRLIDMETLVSGSEIIAIPKGQQIIVQDGTDRDIYFIVSGSVNVIVNGTNKVVINQNSYFGEMALIDPQARRSATVSAAEHCVLLKCPEPHFSKFFEIPEVYAKIAVCLARRLKDQNQRVF